MASGRLELPRPCGQQILSLSCLPIPPRGRREKSIPWRFAAVGIAATVPGLYPSVNPARSASSARCSAGSRAHVRTRRRCCRAAQCRAAAARFAPPAGENSAALLPLCEQCQRPQHFRAQPIRRVRRVACEIGSAARHAHRAARAAGRLSVRRFAKVPSPRRLRSVGTARSRAAPTRRRQPPMSGEPISRKHLCPWRVRAEGWPGFA